MYDTQSESRNLFFASIPIKSFAAEQRNKIFELNLKNRKKNKKKNSHCLSEFLHSEYFCFEHSHVRSVFFLHFCTIVWSLPFPVNTPVYGISKNFLNFVGLKS